MDAKDDNSTVTFADYQQNHTVLPRKGNTVSSRHEPLNSHITGVPRSSISNSPRQTRWVVPYSFSSVSLRVVLLTPPRKQLAGYVGTLKGERPAEVEDAV